MNRLQWIVIGLSVALFIVLYFGCETTPKNIKALEKSRVLASEGTDVISLLSEAKAGLSPTASNNIVALEVQLEEALGDTARSTVLKQLSSEWYNQGHAEIAGHYAQEVADVENTEESWSIAGTTYSICIQRAKVEKVKSFCTARAVKAFENAISINPENMAHQVNLALAYTYNPPQDNPMQGILMLRTLNQKAPDNVLVLNTLARLAIQTGQYEKAIERLSKAWSLEENNLTTACLLAQAYEGAGEDAKAEQYLALCRSLSTSN